MAMGKGTDSTDYSQTQLKQRGGLSHFLRDGFKNILQELWSRDATWPGL